MKLLVAGNEKRTGEYLTKGLTGAGLVVDLADNGLNGYHLAMTGDYDLIILDIILSDVNSWDIVCTSRSADKGMPILLLIMPGITEHRAKGSELGADDYPVKPFVFAELLAQVRTLLRCGAVVIIESQSQVANLMVDLVNCKIIRSGTRTTLINRELTLLEFPLHHQGGVLPRSFIASQVWDVNFDNDVSAIGAAVKWLHGKIDNDLEPKLTQIVRGVGYMLGMLDGQ